ncbi:hypothetical protein Tco_1179889, partial [Tanacetum coccineum]
NDASKISSNTDGNSTSTDNTVGSDKNTFPDTGEPGAAQPPRRPKEKL